MMLVFRGAAAAFAVLSLPLAPAALAQEYPAKPIRIIVGPGPVARIAKEFGREVASVDEARAMLKISSR